MNKSALSRALPSLLQAVVEPMETRLLLSQSAPGLLGASDFKYLGKTAPITTHVTKAKPIATSKTAHGKKPAKQATAPAAGLAPAAVATAPFTPTQLRHFYGVDNISFNGVAGNGAGQTIVLIDYNNQPNIKSDLATFDAQFGLPAPPSFVVENQAGQTTNLPTGYDSDDAIEISLDVEYAHAMAPAANLVLIETSFSFSSNTSFMEKYITNGVVRANATAGASVVSMSYGVAEFSAETSYDSYFTQSGITYVASAGDSGAADTVYPSISPNVVSVGGTEITTSDSSGSYGSETTWNDSSDGDGATGGDISTYEAKPSYQSGVAQSATKRTTPDVSMEASVDTGVFVYDSSQSTPGYFQVGGTSLAAPSWAGLIADADQGRAAIGLSPLSGSTQTLPTLYKLPSTVFNDITVGTNNYQNTGGYSAGPGYDLASGIGTPIANLLVPDLAGTGSITGRVFVDTNNNGTYDASTDSVLAGLTVYLDLNNSGIQNSGDPTAITNASGIYSFPGEPAGGSVRLASAVPTGYIQVASTTSQIVGYGSTDTINLAFFPVVYSSAAAATNYTIQTDSTGTVEQILLNGTITDSLTESLLTSLTFTLTGAGDSLTVNGNNGASSGNPVPAGGVSFTGGAAGDPLLVTGTASGADAFTVTSSSISFGANPVNFTHVSLLTLNPGAGSDTLAVNSGSVTIAAPAGGRGIVQRIFSSLSLAAASSALFATASSHSDRNLAIIGSLSLPTGATLDLGGNDAVLQGGNLATLTALIGTGFANGAWNGTGIASAAAAADSTHHTALGILANTAGVFSSANKFDGYSPATADVLIKYTYFGDANLDGHVDGSDYTLIDNGYLTHLTGWSNGDFNFDSQINGSDYTLIDNLFNTQGTVL